MGGTEPTKIFLPCLLLISIGPVPEMATKDKARADWRKNCERVSLCEFHPPTASSSLPPHLRSLSHSPDLGEAASIDHSPKGVCI